MSELNDISTEKKSLFSNNMHILSYYSLLEKIYEQSQDKSHQERIFRINKAINSIKKYSNCKVSSFNLKQNKKTTTNKEKEKENEKENQKNFPPIYELPEEKDNNLEDILLLIEKELKENGINEKDINNSFLSTSKKSLNSSEKKETLEKISPDNSNTNSNKLNNTTVENLSKTINKRRLSKLFLKIELKLKTFLQENNMKKELIKEEKENNNINEEKNEKEINIFDYTFGTKTTKSPSKLPNIIDSFFSDKNKVNSILQKVKKQRRKSVMDFNTKFRQFSKDQKEIEYINDSDDKEKNSKKRKKIMPCSAQVVMRNKITKNNTENVSNFCDMIDEKEEERDDMEDINSFDNVKEEKEYDEKINILNNNIKILNEKSSIINIEKDSSIKISSSLNNKDKFHFNEDKNNNNNINKSNNSTNINVYVESCNNNNCFYISKTSVFNDENEHEDSKDNSFNNNDYSKSLLDDEIFMKSSEKKEMSKSRGESKESGESCSDKSENNSNNDDERYKILKIMNNSENRNYEEVIEEENEKGVSNFGKNNLNESNLKNTLQREISRASNINGFYLNSILSPLKYDDFCNKVNKNNVIEDFSKLIP